MIMPATSTASQKPVRSESAPKRYRIRGRLPIVTARRARLIRSGNDPAGRAIRVPLCPYLVIRDEPIGTASGRAAHFNSGRRTL